MKLREAVSWLTRTLQRNLIPRLEEYGERPLTEKERQLVNILELLQIEKFVGRPAQRFGRKPWERQARAFVGKAVYNQPHTRATIEAWRAAPVFRRLCGFVSRADVPSEATFSRAFAEFAEIGLGDRVHEALVGQWVSPELVGDISRDATAIEGREKPTAKPKPPKAARFCATLKAVGVNLFRATAVRRVRRRAMETGQGGKSRFSQFIAHVKEQISAMGNAIDQFFIPDAYYGPVELKMAA